MKFAAAELLLLAGLLLLSAFVLWDSVSAGEVSTSSWLDPAARLFPAYISRELLLAVSLCIVVYWGLQVLGRSHIAFWLMALFVILPNALAIWDHNQIEWHQLLGLEALLGAERSQLWDTALFLVSLVGLVALYRTIGLRKLGHQMSLQGIEGPDRDRLMLYEGLMLFGLTSAGLLLAFLILLAATMLGRFDALLDWSSWAVVTIGAGATFLLAITLVFWFRGR